jgi:hypothetical protein
VFGIEKFEEYSFIWRVKMLRTENISFNRPEKDEQKPSESKAHMHITKPEICFQNFFMEKTFEKDFPEALSESSSEKSTLQTQFILTRKVAKPDHASYNNINKNEIQPDIEWYDKYIKLHIHLF